MDHQIEQTEAWALANKQNSGGRGMGMGHKAWSKKQKQQNRSNRTAQLQWSIERQNSGGRGVGQWLSPEAVTK